MKQPEQEEERSGFWQRLRRAGLFLAWISLGILPMALAYGWRRKELQAQKRSGPLDFDDVEVPNFDEWEGEPL